MRRDELEHAEPDVEELLRRAGLEAFGLEILRLRVTHVSKRGKKTRENTRKRSSSTG